jgi:hypothetical protein
MATFRIERKGNLWLVGTDGLSGWWVLCPNRAAARLTRKALSDLDALGADRGRVIPRADSWDVEIQAVERFGWRVRSMTWNVLSCGRQICCCATVEEAREVREAFALLSDKEDRKLVA